MFCPFVSTVAQCTAVLVLKTRGLRLCTHPCICMGCALALGKRMRKQLARLGLGQLFTLIQAGAALVKLACTS